MDLYLVDDSAMVRKRLEALLAALPGVTIVGHAEGADEAIRGIHELRPDMVLLDLRLAQGSGFDVLRAVRELSPGVQVCMLSNFASEPYRRAAVQLGALDFYDKTRDFERVRDLVAARARESAAQPLHS